VDVKGTREFLGIIVAGIFAVSACTGSTQADVTETTTTTVGATTTIQATTTTPATTTTTTTQPPLTDDPAGLLGAVNAAMAAQESFQASGTLAISDADAPEAIYVSASLLGGQTSRDNHWITSTLNVTQGDLEGTLVWGVREVDRVDHSQNPISGAWEIDDDEGDPDAVDDALNGRLELASITAEKSGDGYQLTGTYPGDPDVRSVELTVNADLVITSIDVTSTSTRGDLAGLVPDGDGDVVVVESWDLGGYGLRTAEVVPPPGGTVSAMTTAEHWPFQIQIPTHWERATDRDIRDAGLDADAAWLDGDDFLVMILTEDLVAAGFGETELEEYVTFVGSMILDTSEVTSEEYLTNLQGLPVALITGSTDTTGLLAFQRYVYLHEKTLAVNVTIIAPRGTFAEEKAIIDFILNSVIVTG
jgi:hypothetical protein